MQAWNLGLLFYGAVKNSLLPLHCGCRSILLCRDLWYSSGHQQIWIVYYPASELNHGPKYRRCAKWPGHTGVGWVWGAWRDLEWHGLLGASESCWACPRDRGWAGEIRWNYSWDSTAGSSPWQSVPGGCVLTGVTGKGKAEDLFSQSSLREEC